MKGRMVMIAIAALMPVLADEDSDGEAVGFIGTISFAVASAGLSPSNGLYDSLPEATQVLDWRQDLGRFGYLCGFYSIYSSLHDRQHEVRRAAFNDMDGDVCYGYDVDFYDGVALKTCGGPYFDVPVGYHGVHKKCWGGILLQRLENPYVTPYWGVLWLLEPQKKGRIKAGLKKSFEISESLTFSIFAEGAWMDKRRFCIRYGEEPDRNTFGGGAVAFVLSGVRLDWKMTDRVAFFVSYTQYDLVNSQARSAVKRRGRYCDKCDWPIGKIGLSYLF